MKKVHYKLNRIEKLNIFTSENVYILDWEKDFDIINEYYRKHFGICDLKKYDPDDFEVVDTIAYIKDGGILSLAVIYNIVENALEIGAVSTAPNYRGLGYCTACLYFAASRILEKGKPALITTDSENFAMRKVAKKLGFEKIL